MVWKSSHLMVTPKQIGMLVPGSRNLDWRGQRRLGTQISSGSLRPVSPASRVPESPRRRDFVSPTVSRRSSARSARPRPIPFDLVVKKASKSRGMTSGSMPFPEPNRDVDAPRCPTARCSLPLLKSPCFSTLIMGAYRRPEFRTNRQCIVSSLLLPSPTFVMFAPHKFFPSWS
jgi:hypothetical protein